MNKFSLQQSHFNKFQVQNSKNSVQRSWKAIFKKSNILTWFFTLTSIMLGFIFGYLQCPISKQQIIDLL